MRAFLVTLAAAALTLVPLAAAESVDRASVGAQSDGRGWSRALHVVFTSPPEYVRSSVGRLGDDGEWKGPAYRATGKADLGGDSTLDWDLNVRRGGTMAQAIAGNVVQGWPRIAEGAEDVERRVGGRPAPPIRGRWILMQGTPMAGEARYEAVLAFDLCGIWALADIQALLPSGDSAGGSMGFGEYRMADGSKPTDWNRRKVEETLAKIALEGNLPVRRVSAKAAGKKVTGTVADCKKGPVAGVPVRLERKVGSRWVKAGSARTTAAGTFSVAARAAGTYRAAAGGRRSGPVRVR